MSRISRRRFLSRAGAAGAGSAAFSAAAPALAQGAPEISWRLTTSWPKSLDTLFAAAQHFARVVADATDNKFRIQVFADGEIAPGLEATQAVTSGAADLCHTAPYYMWNTDPTFALACAVPFGLNGRMQNAWWREGGGEQLVNAFYAKYGLYGLLAGNTMSQMGGWFRREINTPDDLRGLKMRIAGFAGSVVSRLGVAAHQIAGRDTFQALEKGTVDAAEWVGPYDDEKLGLHRVAKFYYYPGWWEGGTMIHVQVAKAKWDSLPKTYQTIVRAAAAEAHNFTIGRYDALNPQALKRLISAGTELRPYSEAILDACHRATNEAFAEFTGRNEDFKTIWDSIKAFRLDQYLWLQVADATYDNYMVTQHRKRTL